MCLVVRTSEAWRNASRCKVCTREHRQRDEGQTATRGDSEQWEGGGSGGGRGGGAGEEGSVR